MTRDSWRKTKINQLTHVDKKKQKNKYKYEPVSQLLKADITNNTEIKKVY